MTATTALDQSGVEYYFACTSGAGHDSGWQDGSSYEDTGLDPNTIYTYTATARDKSYNENTTAPSEPRSARTSLSGDFEPDGDVDFADYAHLTLRWLDVNCDQTQGCDGADIYSDGVVNWLDLERFAANWLK